jgi:hypothetical protein
MKSNTSLSLLTNLRLKSTSACFGRANSLINLFPPLHPKTMSISVCSKVGFL